MVGDTPERRRTRCIDEALAGVQLRGRQLLLHLVDVFGVDEVEQALPRQVQLETQSHVISPFVLMKLGHLKLSDLFW